MGVIAQSLTTILASVFIAFYFVWELALALLGFFPIIVFVGKIQTRIMQGHVARDKEAIEAGGKVSMK